MPSLDTYGKIGAAQIAFYTPVAIFTIALVFRYAFRRDAGWLFLFIFSAVRIAEGALTLAGELATQPKIDFTIAAYILQTAGLAPLLLSNIGFLGMAGQSTYSEISRVSLIFRITGLLTLAGLGLSVAGGLLGTHVSPDKGDIGLTLRRASTGIFAGVYVVLFLGHSICWTYHFQMRSYRMKLLGGATLALPFLGVRVAYAILAAWSASDIFGTSLSQNPIFAKFNPTNGQWIAYLCSQDGIADNYSPRISSLTTGSLFYLNDDDTPFLYYGTIVRLLCPAMSTVTITILTTTFFPQTQQGADLIASALKATVFMPDFFEPNAAFPAEKYPPKSDKDKTDLQDFFGGVANPAAAIEKLNNFGNVLKSTGAKNIAVYGFCWGGKVTISSGGASTPFDAVALVHPAMLSVADAEKLTVPLGIYISKDEPIKEYEKILDVVSKKAFADKNDHKNYSTMHHGWAAARGNLEDAENKEQYEDVYERLVNFFCKAFGRA
ncbi:hypothetical protein H0H93_013041 [Arthromyces matolae]|nr:hypothetical protein H0H93_013041 [Arthromyces matolae]